MRLPALLSVTALALTAATVAAAETPPAPEARLELTTAECRRLVVAHAPSADVAYRPGVDVYGRPVAPADLGSRPPLELPDRIVIDVLIPLRQVLGNRAPPRTEDSEVRLGEIVLEGDRLSFNGQPLADPEAQAVAAACRKALARD